MTHTRYDIPCPHESGTPISERCSDYYPLTKPEIADLLYTAKQAMTLKDDQLATVASIQCRLDQGVVGVVCPREDEGATDVRMAQLDQLFVDYMSDQLDGYTDEEVVEELYLLMQG